MDQHLGIALPKMDTWQLLSFVGTNFGFALTMTLVSCLDIITDACSSQNYSILIAAKTYPRWSVTRLLEFNAFGQDENEVRFFNF